MFYSFVEEGYKLDFKGLSEGIRELDEFANFGIKGYWSVLKYFMN